MKPITLSYTAGSSSHPHAAVAVIMVVLAACGTGGSDSGDVTLPGIAKISFADGALPSNARAAIETRRDQTTFAAFDDTASIYQPTSRSSYQVRITTGTIQPRGAATVVLNVPTGLVASEGQVIRMFAWISEVSELDEFDAFEALRSNWDAAAGTVSATVPSSAFTANRSGDGTVECVLILATIPGRDSIPRAEQPLLSLGECPSGYLHTPLLRSLHVTSPFDPNRVDPISGQPSHHWGTDLRAATGTRALAVGAGAVIESGTNGGYGETVVLQIPGVGKVRYAHLKAGTRAVQKGDVVSQGQVIAETDNSGHSKDPHLHLELVNEDGYKDAGPCLIPPDYSGTITNTLRATGNDGSTATITVRANVTFTYSPLTGWYNAASGTWDGTMSVAGGCTGTGSGTGPIRPTDGFIFFDDLEADPVTYSSPMGSSAGSIEFTWTCRDGQRGSYSLPVIIWGPGLLERTQFTAHSDGTLAESNVPVLYPAAGVDWIVTWRLCPSSGGPRSC